MTVSVTSEDVVNRNSISFWFRLNLVKEILGGDAKDSGEVRFEEEVLLVF